MTLITLPSSLATKIAALYSHMEQEYDRVAQELSFGCEGCNDNCCDSFFMHHTYLEWAYLWEGLNALPEQQRENVISKAQDYVLESEASLARGQQPQVMCPLNQEGLCTLYSHRLMICRMHGVPSVFVLPNGQRKDFPGCFCCQEITAGRENLPSVDRTELYRELAALEGELLGAKRGLLPRIKKTIARMIVDGPPVF